MLSQDAKTPCRDDKCRFRTSPTPINPCSILTIAYFWHTLNYKAMKVLLINASPHPKGCTYTALCEVASALNANGFETELMQLGVQPIAGCIGCGQCRTKGNCFRGDVVNQFVDVADQFDGYVFGSPVHYASAATAALDQLNKYFTINCMPVVSSNYWNMVHGSTPDDVLKDLEGMQTMRILGNNMAWLLKCIEAGKSAGVPAPATEQKVWTNFIKD